METNVLVTTAFEYECRVPSTETALTVHYLFIQHAVEIEGDSPLIAVTEAFDA
jgi:hypothetical protein